MDIIRVIPISRGISKSELSYFSANDIPIGSIVGIPLRSKEVPALVVGSEDLKNAKSRIRSADFKLKKISVKKGRCLLSFPFIEASRKTANERASSLGAALHSLIPKVILEDIEKIAEPVFENESKERKTNYYTPVSESLILQDTFENRIENYKNLIRESFARNESILLVAPTIREAEDLYYTLKKGVENISFLLHSGQTKKEQIENWNGVIKKRAFVFAVLTFGFVSIPAFNIGTIILENENSHYYKMIERPYVSARGFLVNFSKVVKARLVLSGMPLSAETYYKYKKGEVERIDAPVLRVEHFASLSILNMREKENAKERRKKQKKEFKILDDRVWGILENLPKSKRKVFLFASRKGLSPITVCEDCGESVKCSKCGGSLTLYKKGSYNSFVCHSCGYESSALLKCANCESWKLKDLGIGSEKIEEYVRKNFPELNVFRLDKDSASTHKKAEKLMGSFNSSEGAVLVGTESALSYVKGVETSVVVSFDSLLSIPEFKIQEKVFSLLLKISSKTRNSLFIQTRDPENKLLKSFKSGDIASFFEDELKVREKLDYPPFSKILKIVCKSSLINLAKDVKKAEGILNEHGIQKIENNSRPAFKNKGKEIIIAKVSSELLKNKEVLDSFKKLPPSCALDTDPINLFN